MKSNTNTIQLDMLGNQVCPTDKIPSFYGGWSDHENVWNDYDVSYETDFLSYEPTIEKDLFLSVENNFNDKNVILQGIPVLDNSNENITLDNGNNDNLYNNNDETLAPLLDDLNINSDPNWFNYSDSQLEDIIYSCKSNEELEDLLNPDHNVNEQSQQQITQQLSTTAQQPQIQNNYFVQNPEFQSVKEEVISLEDNTQTPFINDPVTSSPEFQFINDFNEQEQEDCYQSVQSIQSFTSFESEENNLKRKSDDEDYIPSPKTSTTTPRKPRSKKSRFTLSAKKMDIKEQNKVAAKRYREKINNEKKEMESALVIEEAKHGKLRTEVEELQIQVTVIKELLSKYITPIQMDQLNKLKSSK